MIHTVKGFSVVNEAEVDVFLELLCFLHNPRNFGNLIFDSSAFSISSLYIWKFMVHVLLKPSLKDFEHDLTSMRNESNCMVVLTFFGTPFLWDWNENGPFPVLVATAEFSKFADILSIELYLIASSFRILNSSAGIPSPPLALFAAMLPKAHLTLHSRMSGCR